MPLITEMWAWVCEERVLAATAVIGGHPHIAPLIGADRERIESYRKLAQEIAGEAGKKLMLLRFSVRENVEVLRP